MESKRDLDAYEARRVKGVALFERGYRASEVAVRTCVSRQAVSQWLRNWRQGGKSALSRVRSLGRPSRLTPKQRERLAGMLTQGATAHGFPTDLWSGQRVVKLVSDTFGVTLHYKHIPRLLRSLGWQRRKSRMPTVVRAEAATARWVASGRPRGAH